MLAGNTDSGWLETMLGASRDEIGSLERNSG